MFASLGGAKGMCNKFFDSSFFSDQNHLFFQTLPGPYPSKVDSLAFVIRHPDDLGPDDVPSQSDLRLFSSGGGSELIEWDLERGCIRVRFIFLAQNALL